MAEQVPEIRVPIPPQIEIIFFFAKRKVDNSRCSQSSFHWWKLQKYLQVSFQHFVSKVECNFAKLYRKVLDIGVIFSITFPSHLKKNTYILH